MLRLNVLIATHGRTRLLERTLDSLVETSRPAGFEHIHVIENGSDAGAADICRRAKLKLPVEYRHEQQAGKARALQRMIEQLGGGLVVFLDDDVRVSPQLFDSYARAADAEGGGCFYGGPLLIDYEKPPPDWLAGRLPVSAAGWQPNDPDNPFEGQNSRFLGANYGVMVETLLGVGGLHGGLGPGAMRPGCEGNPSGEETELQDRLIAAGVRPKYLPEARVWHYVPRQRATPRWALGRHYRNRMFRAMIEPQPSGKRLWFDVPVDLWRQLFALGLTAMFANFHPSPRARFERRLPYYRLRGYIHGLRVRAGMNVESIRPATR